MTEHIERLTAALADRYEIKRELGQGGMATVYLAHDVRHERDVALKLLRPELAAMIGGERFLQEIRLTAKLQHPNILPLFDSGDAEGLLYYVMPYVDGESLRDRVDRETQLPVEEAVRIASEVADALNYAHEQDVLHRDIKPDNILLSGGHALVADFGIARAVSAAGGERITVTGLAVGTPAYMSPEQATAGDRLDGRTDVYSLASVLYEMLAGEPPFTGPTLEAVIARRLTETPRALRTVRDTVPVAVDLAVSKALAKLPADRPSTAKAFGEALARPSSDAMLTAAVAAASEGFLVRKRSVPTWQVMVASVVIVAASAFGWWTLGRPEPPAPVMRFEMTLTSARPSSGLAGHFGAISPDGSKITYVGDGPQLYLRHLDRLEPEIVSGTEGAYGPVFSPDGEWIAFGTETGIKKVAVGGGAPILILDLPGVVSSISWGDEDQILADAPTGSRLIVISASGGEERVVEPQMDSDDQNLSLARLLPGGEFAVAAVVQRTASGAPGSGELVVIDIESGAMHRLGIDGLDPTYLSDGYLAMGRMDGSIYVVPFELGTWAVSAAPIPVVPNVRLKSSAIVDYAVSSSGTLVYAPAEGARRRLVLVNRQGRSQPLSEDVRTFYGPRFSPDGERVAVTVFEHGKRDVWLYDVTSGVGTRQTSEGDNLYPVWSPDGSRLAFTSTRDGAFDLYTGEAGGGRVERIFQSATESYAAGWTADGASVLFTEEHASTGRGIWMVPSTGGDAVRVADEAFEERSPSISPDGRWLAYASNETGRMEAYVSPLDGSDGRWGVSVEGGVEPVWSRDGTELFFRVGTQFIAATVAGGSSFRVLRRTPMFDGAFVGNPFHANYDYDGRRDQFVMVESVDAAAKVVVVTNWLDEIKRAVN